MTYDLLIKGGHVLDPAQGLDATLDIAVSGGKIAKIAADIPEQDAARVLEIRGPGRTRASPRSRTAARSASPTSASSPPTSCRRPRPAS
jgi:hypothetical protein